MIEIVALSTVIPVRNTMERHRNDYIRKTEVHSLALKKTKAYIKKKKAEQEELRIFNKISLSEDEKSVVSGKSEGGVSLSLSILSSLGSDFK